MKESKKLKTRMTIGVCAPCARFDTDRLKQGVTFLEDLGFRVIVPDIIFQKKRYLAGTDHQRAQVLMSLYEDSQIDAIIAARGGFGSIRILNHLDWDLIEKTAKPFVGFSDCTAFLNAYIEQTGNHIIHGPTIISLLDSDKKTQQSFLKILTKPTANLEYSCKNALIPGKGTGILKGGNLATLCSMIGTPFMPNLSGSILFIEDIGEPAYKIDRMLTQMKFAEVFDQLTGVVIGTFKNCENESYLDEIFLEFFQEYETPVLSGLGCGHGRTNLSLPLGVTASLDSQTLSLAID